MPTKKNVKKKNPTTVSNSITSGKTVKFVDPKTGITHITNDAGGKTTYHKYNKDGTFAGGYTQNAFGVFGAGDGGRKIPISADAYTKKPEVEKMKKEFIPNKPATGETVAELWKKTTGTSWSEAKKQGLTDGSMKANLALMSKLKSGDYKPKPKEEVKVEPKVEPKISSYIKPDEVGPYYSKDEDPNKGKMGPIEDPNKPKLKRGGSIKSNITAIKSKIKSKIMAIKKPKMAMGGTKKIVLKKPIKKAMYGTAMKPTMMRSGGTTKKYLNGGTTGTQKYDDQPKKATTLKKAMYGTMMKPKIMIKGSTKKK